jgi:hypothetical protein
MIDQISLVMIPKKLTCIKNIKMFKISTVEAEWGDNLDEIRKNINENMQNLK